MKLIDKDKVVAEIDKRLHEYKKEYEELAHYEIWGTAIKIKPKIEELKKFRSFINTIETKEVDLEEEINDFLNEEYRYTEYEGKWVDEKDWRDSIQRCARHFYELGLKAKGE